MRRTVARHDHVPVEKPSPARLFVLVTALSVPFWVLGWVTDSMLPAGLPISSLMVVCPLVATVALVHHAEGRTGLHGLFRRLAERPKPLWLLAAVVTMPAITAVAQGLPHVSVPAVAASVVVFLIAAACEEIAWSGYAIDPLHARFGELRAALLMGVFWSAWHLIGWSQAHDVAWVAWQALFTVAVRVLIVRVYTGSGGNVLVATVFHCMINVCFAILGPAYQPMPTALVTSAAAVCVVVAQYSRRRVSGSGNPGPGRGSRRRGRAPGTAT